MGRYEKKIVSKTKNNERQKISNNLYDNGDVPNKSANLGYRLLYTIIAWFVLANGVSKEAFIVSAFLFTIPIFMDCIKFTPTNNLRKFIIYLERVFSGFWLLVFSLGLCNVLVVKECDGILIMTNAESFIGGEMPVIPIRYIWQCMLSLVFITAVDWFCQFMRLDTGGDSK